MEADTQAIEIPRVGAVIAGSPFDRALGAVLGLAVGDALGTSFEFDRLEQPTYPTLARGPATDITGGGPFGLAPGQITDDTQLAVCLARSLADHGRLDTTDVARRYVAWHEHAFDCGNQTGAALARLAAGAAASDPGRAVWRASGRRAAGNGSLMRTAPLALVLDGEPLIDAAIAESQLTHADPRCLLACAVYDVAIACGVAGAGVTAGDTLARAARRLRMAWADERGDAATIDAAEAELARDLDAARGDDPGVYGHELHVDRTAGYVRVAFRLAWWHAEHTRSWRDAVVDVASRGGDADTNAAIVGALLGARDGASAIPPEWIARVLAATQPGPAAWADAHHPRHLVALARARVNGAAG
jgi:ADP-ribosylglycohydrolase